MALPRLEFCLSLEVDVSGTETAVIDVLVHGSYRHINLWMICQNLIGRLALIDQRRYNLINRMQFLPRAINPTLAPERSSVYFRSANLAS